MKKLLIIILCASFNLTAMQEQKSASINAPVQIYFMPQDTATIRTELDSLLDNAKERLYVAMYWLTDAAIIKKILDAKKRGVEVRVVFDESMYKFRALIPALKLFIKNEIIPLVYPSSFIKDISALKGGLMHNKFLIIDDAVAWTGSANLTGHALSAQARAHNSENILIFNSKDVNAKYVAAFEYLENKIFNLYAHIISKKWRKPYPVWLLKVVPTLYKHNNGFKVFIDKYKENISDKQKVQMKQTIPQPKIPFVLTPRQKIFFKRRGISTQGMTRKQVQERIDKEMGKENVPLGEKINNVPKVLR